jgi:hypothetical protein
LTGIEPAFTIRFFQPIQLFDDDQGNNDVIVFKTLHGIRRLNEHIRIEYISLCLEPLPLIEAGDS